jgi:hypothetical protein
MITTLATSQNWGKKKKKNKKAFAGIISNSKIGQRKEN